MKKLIILLLIPILMGCTKEPYPIQLSAEYIVPLDTITAPDGDQIIFEKRMTATEKIKKRFKEIHDAKIERLKECEDNGYKFDAIKISKTTVPLDSIENDRTKPHQWIWQKDLPARTNEWYIFEGDWTFSDGTILLAYRNKTKTNYVCYDIFAKALVGMWDEYAKECYADSTLLHTIAGIDEEKEKEWHEQNPNKSKMWVFTKSNNIFTHKQPNLIEFIEFLRNKLKGE